MTDQFRDRPAIQAVDLTRTYNVRKGWLRPTFETVEAVRTVSFSVYPGETFGLLGPNGAGKTTTIKMLNTLLLPTSGTARVLGFDVAKDPVEVRRRIGYVFGGDKGLYDRLSANDNLRYFAELYGVPPREQRSRVHELLDKVGLSGRAHERVEGYSRGMRQRLHIARGLLHRPQVLFLDEPSLGLDPVAARELRRTVAELSGEGVTTVLTTHYMAEADELCDRIAIVDSGVIRVLGTPDELKGSVARGTVVEATVRGADETHLSRLRDLPSVQGVAVTRTDGSETVLTVRGENGTEIHTQVVSALRGLRITRLTSREPTLEDAYVAIVGSGAEPGATDRKTSPEAAV
ncbi:ABC transporter ATP-binding protein [Streptomyces sp. NBC_01716]|uniref:ABC transporter ATP-binding protein n=1 Tax=Streptomyces sp. NBC_01716 TaxID=2975917 RepID=UPI002E2F51D9|nr:ABC transporter ATP-binding protein [Streptomyces sp. NBC_01716]